LSPRSTIHEVAKAAGVSVGTASDALNGRGRVAPKTREHVAAVAASLGYRPRASAKALREGRTMSIGLRFGGQLVPSGEFIVDLLNGAATAAHARGYGLLMTARGLSERELVDGLIIVDPVDAAELDVPGLKLMTIGQAPRGSPSIPSVDVRYSHVVSSLMAHVAPRARQDGCVWVLDSDSTPAIADVVEAVTEWCAGHGREGLVVDCGAEEAAIAPTLEGQVDRTGLPAVVVAPTPRQAEAAQRYFAGRGADVTSDVIVVSSLADTSLRMAEPPIVGVHADGWAHGSRAVEVMISWIEDDAYPEDIVLEPGLAGV
jgi:DNA-binding LacI/PurR family transcriptional regulator